MKRKTKIISIIGVVIALIIGILFLDDYNTIPVELKQETFTFEYGDEFSNDISTYFNIINNDKYEKTKSEFNLSIPKSSEVGIHNCSIEWRGQTIPFKIEVKDTQAPVIELNKDKVSIKYGATYDVKTNIKSVKDPVDGNIEYKTEGTVNNKKAGDYKIKVTAIDKNNNSVSKEFTVTVEKEVVAKKTTTSSKKTTSKKTTSKKKKTTTQSVSSSYPMTYKDSTSKITITKEWYKKAWCYVAHIEFTDYDRLKTQCGNNKFGGKETIKHAANRTGAILAINGCYSAPKLKYITVRNGKVYYGKNKACWMPAFYSQNTGKLYNAWETNGDPAVAGKPVSSLVNQGLLTDSFCFGPPILVNGKVSNNSDKSRAQRTFIGSSGKAGDIWLVVSDGRYVDGKSAGLTYKECAQLLKNKGCKFGVPLDGGGSSTMVFKGKVLNKATNRAVVDFVYFK